MIEKTIIITGASGKVGNAILKDLSGKDYKIIATYKSNKIKLKSKNIIIKKLDQSKELDISNLIKFISKKKLNLIGIINCGVLRPMKKGSKDNIKNWTKSILVNSNSSYLINKKFGDYFYNKKFGRIVHIGSIYSVVGPDFNLYKNENFELEPDYLYNKFGMVGLVKYFASKYGDKNVTVNIVSPGGIKSNQSNSFIKKYSKKTFIKRMANAEEISGLVEFLLSKKSSYLTGQNIILDGGYTSN